MIFMLVRHFGDESEAYDSYNSNELAKGVGIRRNKITK